MIGPEHREKLIFYNECQTKKFLHEDFLDFESEIEKRKQASVEDELDKKN